MIAPKDQKKMLPERFQIKKKLTRTWLVVLTRLNFLD